MRGLVAALSIASVAVCTHAFVPQMTAGGRQAGGQRVRTVASLQRHQRGLKLYSVPGPEEDGAPEAPVVEAQADPTEPPAAVTLDEDGQGAVDAPMKPKGKGKGEFYILSDEEAEALPPMERDQYEKAKEAARLRAAEKFIVRSTGDYECRSCAYVYMAKQNDRNFEDLPGTWKCPVCRAPKDTFMAQTVTIAGFEENQGYGFGTNSMTGGQKNLLIFGGLGAFLALFLLGYALE
eukprot:TRINITY_DN2877_c0_g1_i1.p1 TRINITY_DN2877_c0_g1~~TRINITY_DN2877_c0_g1_i1.p1  ORF type:complete len:235 (+),score=76.04 TRINITY_DN2877_c0_g1_i1:90-794(+)